MDTKTLRAKLDVLIEEAGFSDVIHALAGLCESRAAEYGHINEVTIAESVVINNGDEPEDRRYIDHVLKIFDLDLKQAAYECGTQKVRWQKLSDALCAILTNAKLAQYDAVKIVEPCHNLYESPTFPAVETDPNYR